ncbi:hypothetical protein FRB90_005157 [Tulasnella sp. 427]|nr:hypothetical protein FRB90_005157 [Tulasnella sp. 427]
MRLATTSLVTLLTVIVVSAGGLSAESSSDGIQHANVGRMTNAKRLAMGLPPLKPKSLRRGTRAASARRSSTSPVPPTLHGCNIQAKWTSDGSFIGYLSPTLDSRGRYGAFQATQAGALEVQFYAQDDECSDELDLVAVNGPNSAYPYVGATVSTDGLTYAYITATTQTSPGSDAVPQGNSHDSTHGTESAIWKYDPLTQAITPQWYSGGPKADGSLVWTASSRDPNILTITYEVTGYWSVYESKARPVHQTNSPAPNSTYHQCSSPYFRINDLPSEIVGRVFEASVDRLGVNPLTLMLVCQSWRQLALSTPALWTKISLPSYIQHLEEKVAAYLERSKTLLVSVIIGRRSSIGCLRVVMLFQSHLERIRSLTCFVAVGSVDVLWSFVNGMTILEELVLEKSPEISPTISYRKNALDIPSLRRFHIVNVDISWKDTILPNVEDLQLLYNYFQSVLIMDRLFDTLSQFTLLKRLFIGLHSHFPLYIQFWDESRPRPNGPIVVPLLQELGLHGLADQRVEMVLSIIVAPRLDALLLLEGKNEGFVEERWQKLADRFPHVRAPQLIK